jgi:hypothetical protein
MRESTKKRFRELFILWQKNYGIKELNWYDLPPVKLRLSQRASDRIFGSVGQMLEQWFPHTHWKDQLQSSSPELELQVSIINYFFVEIHHMKILKFNFLLKSIMINFYLLKFIGLNLFTNYFFVELHHIIWPCLFVERRNSSYCFIV